MLPKHGQTSGCRFAGTTSALCKLQQNKPGLFGCVPLALVALVRNGFWSIIELHPHCNAITNGSGYLLPKLPNGLRYRSLNTRIRHPDKITRSRKSCLKYAHDTEQQFAVSYTVIEKLRQSF